MKGSEYNGNFFQERNLFFNSLSRLIHMVIHIEMTLINIKKAFLPISEKLYARFTVPSTLAVQKEIFTKNLEWYRN